MKRYILCIILSLTLLVLRAQVFVSASAENDNGDGLSWETAKKTIPAALTLVGESGEVYVKAGNYSLSAQLTIPAGVSVKGGYSISSTGTDTTHRELPGLNSRWGNSSICTIITGDGTHRIASVNGTLEGCLLRRGYTGELGGGVLIDGGTVRYCVIKGCDAINENTLAAEGGGAYIRNNGLLTNCVITECRGDKGPAVSGGNGSLINNTITRNWPTHCGTVADYDGNVYNTVVLGQQCWTKENMRTTHYYDGTPIPSGTMNSSTEPYRYYNYTDLSASMLNDYGYLYNWTAVMHGAPSTSANPSGVTGICPLGWHVPSDSEFVEMREFVNSVEAFKCNGYNGNIAKALASKTRWPNYSGCSAGSNQSTNNHALFTAYPTGNFDAGFSERSWANFWTTKENGNMAVSFYIRYDNSYLNNDAPNKYQGRSVRCVKSLSETEPVIHTLGVEVVSSTVANCGGMCSNGGSHATARGICWSTSPNPTIADNHTTDGNGEGTFSSQMTNLTPSVTYYVRAYVVNSDGAFYGEERSFTPAACGDLVVHDYDGNNYNTVQIGTQCWLKDNLRSTHYANGVNIPYSNYSYSGDPYYYRNPSINDDDLAAYGFHYNWSAVMNGATSSDSNPSSVQGICPDGWHLPSKTEWNQLIAYLGSNSSYWCDNNPEYLAKALASQTDWYTYSYYNCIIGNDLSTNNVTGFTAMPAGYRYVWGEDYYNLYRATYYWSSTQYENDSGCANNIRLYYSERGIGIDYSNKYEGLSVRCVKNN